MNILIIGGAGFIGSNLALKLLSKNYTVTILDNLSPQVHGLDPDYTSQSYNSIKNKVHFIRGSITSKRDLKRAILNQDIIVNLAAETGTGQSMYQIERYISVNISGTASLLDILVNGKHRIKKIVIASSRAIYGEGKYFSEELGFIYPAHRIDSFMNAGDFNVKYDGITHLLKPMPTDEISKIHPSSIYGITKQAQEQLIMSTCPKIGIDSVAFRYQNVYGPHQSLLNPYTGVISVFSALIKNKDAINIFEDGEQSRDFLYIDDAVEATVLGIEKEEANNEIFNVGTGIDITINNLVNEMMTNYKEDVPVRISGNYRLADIRHNRADLTKINQYLNFTPKISFKEGLKKFCEWVDNQDVVPISYESSLAEMRRRKLMK